ncbi:MAG: hypothetical protein KAG61_00465 [Bacteriovoracaceae bacterium]|nr:hypothetical protein [Bacteriovoracaceae bacterium]
MENKLFIIFQVALNIIRGLLYPLTVEVLGNLIPAVRRRKLFELLNKVDPLSKSFYCENKVAAVAFEVSSEGELEQVRPLINNYLKKGDLVELIYSSESVEKKCQSMAVQWKGMLRIYRLPILTFFFFDLFSGQSLSSWMTARRLVLCRYDFFPELLLLGKRDHTRFVLVNASLKNKESMNPLRNFIFRNIFSLFDSIICASGRDLELFTKMGIDPNHLVVFDFRLIQIEKRVSSSDATLSKILTDFAPIFDKYPAAKRLIMGSAWPNEMEVFSDSEFISKIVLGDLFVAVTPHKLDEKHMNSLTNSIEEISDKFSANLPIYIYRSTLSVEQKRDLIADFIERPGIIIVATPGILCELYNYFGHSYVGGGHGRSIHSVLEPFIANSMVYCGPKTHRSTEFDFVKSFDDNSVTVIKELSSFYKIFRPKLNQINDEIKHGEFIHSYTSKFEKVVTFLHLGT